MARGGRRTGSEQAELPLVGSSGSFTDHREEDELLPDLPRHLAERTRVLRPRAGESGSFVLYWMRTAVRAHENPALDLARVAADALALPMFVVQTSFEDEPFASDRHHRFDLEGARDVAAQLAAAGLGYAFHLARPGHRGPVLERLAGRAALLVSEDLPTPALRTRLAAVLLASETPTWVVDTSCVLPMRLSGPRPSRAYSFRDRTAAERSARLRGPWPEVSVRTELFLPTDLPFEPVDLASSSLEDLIASCDIDHAVGPVWDTPGGTTAGYERWRGFLRSGLAAYRAKRNDATLDGTSRLSAYLNRGHVSPLRIAREAAAQDSAGAEKFLDELLIWRELAYTWCLHERNPASESALPNWARETLARHASDERRVLSWERLARGETEDELWNLAQKSLRIHGELHNNVRMTWAKALPYWCPDLSTTIDRLLDLNDRYALDGRHPASYGGLLWSLGLFDRPFPRESRVLGRLRSRPTAAHAKRLDLSAYRARVLRPRRRSTLRVAVVGAGIAGLVCARILREHGIEPVVFDKGRGPGGRTCSRRTANGHLDHGAQFFRARHPDFQRAVESWAHEGLVARWRGRFRENEGDGSASQPSDDSRWVGVPTMGALGRHLARGLNVRSSTRVVSLERRSDVWAVGVEEDQAESFDQVVLTLPAPQAAILLGEHAWADRLDRVQIAPCLAVGARFEAGLDLGFDAARLEARSPLAWVAREASKPGREDRGWWTLHGAPDWTRKHQDGDRDSAGAELLRVFEETFSAPAPLETFVHLWRYALVEKPLGVSCLYETREALVWCGDGCLGGRLEAAWESGVSAAGRLLGAGVSS